MSEFWAMGGHGLYVWLAYGSGVIVLVSLCIEPIVKRKSIIRELSQLNRRQIADNQRSDNQRAQSMQSKAVGGSH